ncbi:hypothetical protein JK361_37300 [Streptomyces sp. 5-8]|uniref:Uncharacterized protein n=1 Tax=Streptomyces musisoli TaxID=2802280 RepID=A0ABS1PDC4_9ACTN|nr:hypothetical protein [Streptomyces musisoli]MBL1110154.1 hypothetical protein [Streptomyces musisoli]
MIRQQASSSACGVEAWRQRNHPDRLLASGGLAVQVNTSDKYGLAAFDTAPASDS